MGRRLANGLTERQREVIRLTSLGCTIDDIAAILDISRSTVDNHRTRVMKLLGIDKSVILTRFAIRHRISPISDRLTPEEERRKVAHTAPADAL